MVEQLLLLVHKLANCLRLITSVGLRLITTLLELIYTIVCVSPVNGYESVRILILFCIINLFGSNKGSFIALSNLMVMVLLYRLRSNSVIVGVAVSCVNVESQRAAVVGYTVALNPLKSYTFATSKARKVVFEDLAIIGLVSKTKRSAGNRPKYIYQ